MPRATFERELQQLQDELLALGSRVEQTITDSVQLLRRRDFIGSRRLIAADLEINEERYAIENACLGLIARQQPMAGDLRTIAAVLEIATELERISDYAKGIAKINLMIGNQTLVKPLVDIPLMAEKARDMLHRALAAFALQDVATAQAIPLEDDEVDNLYLQVYRELADVIIADPSTIDRANYLLWVAHNLERTADRVTNICERVVFTVTGQMVELEQDPAGLGNLRDLP
jgi:phosphate transport system protein